ncbi:MAG: hypothetical protein VX694_16740 [Planctomycetota bacterium]|nr:hypothetical protein [Planctomycetota bacterium]
MKFHPTLSIYCLYLCLSGCGPMHEGSQTQTNTAPKQSSKPKADNGIHPTMGASQATGQNTAPLLTDSLSPREELQKYIERFKNETNWTFNERHPGELKGQWLTVDKNDSMVEFNLTGVEGTFSSDFNGKRSIGVYAISETGRVVCYSRWNDIGLRTHFQLERGFLTGSRGPSPRVQWKRTNAAENKSESR